VNLSIEQVNRGELPAGTELGDYVEVTGSPKFGPNTQQIGVPESEIAVSFTLQRRLLLLQAGGDR
jgi:hypothetical protein